MDPNAEEEALMEAVVSVALGESGELVGVFKPGGTVEAGDASMTSVLSLGSFARFIRGVRSRGSVPWFIFASCTHTCIRRFFRLNYM